MSQAGALQDGSSLPGIETLTGNSGGAVPGTGSPVNVNIVGGSGVTVTGSPGTSTLTIDLTGGGIAVDSIGLQTGTTPCVPTALGLITYNGATVAAGTNPVRTNGTAVNTMALEVQISQAVAASDATRIGLSNYNSAQFTCDANGFVSIPNFSPFNYVQINNASSPYVVLSTDYYISCDSSGGAITVQLPNTTTNYRLFTIKDRTGSAGTNAISVTTVGGVVNIDGATTLSMNTNYQSISLIWNGASYEVF